MMILLSFASEVASILLETPGIDLEAKRTEQVAKIGENIRISRSQVLDPSRKWVGRILCSHREQSRCTCFFDQ